MRRLRGRAGGDLDRPGEVGAVRGGGEVGADGIWRHAERFGAPVPEASRLSHGEGGTPLVPYARLAAACGLEQLWLKREDLNPGGSFKARGLAFQVAYLASRPGAPATLVISSSGNGALAAAMYGALAGRRVVAVVSPDTHLGKLARLHALGAVILLSSQAIGLARAIGQARGWPNLRPSTDPMAPEGFRSLGWELAAEPAPVDAIFTYASSGTALVGMGRALTDGSAGHRPVPGLHAVQGVGAGGVAAHFDPRPGEPRADVGRLGAGKTRRLGEAVRLIRATGGGGWSVDDREVGAAARLLVAEGIDAAPEAAAALAGAMRAGAAGHVRRPVVVLSGRGEPDLGDGAGAPAGPVLDASAAGVAAALARIDDGP